MKKYCLLLLLSLLMLSCKEKGVDPIIEEYTGITETAENGDVIGNVDEGDWLKQFDVKENGIPLSYSVEPAFPNPTTRSTTIKFSLPMNDSVVIVLDDRAINKKTTLLSKTLPAGIHMINVDLKYGDVNMKREEAIARIFFYIPSIKNFPNVHGDIKILKD